MSEIMQLDGVDTWIEECMTDYDAALGELEYTKTLPNEGEAEKIVVLGKMRRAERHLVTACIKADAASLVQSLKNGCTKGEISIVIPEINLDVKLQW